MLEREALLSGTECRVNWRVNCPKILLIVMVMAAFITIITNLSIWLSVLVMAVGVSYDGGDSGEVCMLNDH